MKERTKVILTFIAVVGFMLAVIITFFMGIKWPDWLVYVVAYIAFGTMAFIGIAGYIKSCKNKKISKSSGVAILRGKIVDHAVRRDDDMSDLYAPIYEYYYNGETHRLKSDVATSKKGREVGTEVKIAYRYETGEFFCVDDLKHKKGIDLVFGILGIAAVVLIALKHTGIL